jgi:hypothetical protein
MELKNKMKVIAPSGCVGLITKGKEYEVYDVTKETEPFVYSFNIINDNGSESDCLLNGCVYLNGGNWIIKDESKAIESKQVNIKHEFELLIEVFSATDNLYAKKKVKRIFNQLKKLAKDNPNDQVLGEQIRKLLL